jgi:heat shock protein HslJ
MKIWLSRVALTIFTVCGTTLSAQQPSGTGAISLAGTSWQLVRFEGGDGSVLTPDDGSKYTIAFGGDNVVTVRFDCNRGRGPWMSPRPSRLELGALVVTRALCPPGSLHDHILRQWGSIRAYVVRNGHLFLALMADGGIYEFRPAEAPTSEFQTQVQFRGPGVWVCTGASGTASRLRVTFYKTEPALVVLERDAEVRPAFQTKAASGARYEGDGVLFWEANGAATLNWMGVESTCKPPTAGR